MRVCVCVCVIYIYIFCVCVSLRLNLHCRTLFYNDWRRVKIEKCVFDSVFNLVGVLHKDKDGKQVRALNIYAYVYIYTCVCVCCVCVCVCVCV